MGVINLLSPQMANLIAAGEVVERPGSVVKEIIENAIDAGSTRIEVEIKNGGVTYIRVSDDGCGMVADDVPRAFLRHATSKIREPRDMQAIGTMGFRGEALAAISSVSKVDIFTRTADSLSGIQMTCEGGEAGEPTETGCPKGTTVIIRDLFYNVPARMKFLKRDATEAAYCESAVTSAALANPHISFRLIKDGRESFFSPGKGDLLQVIAALCGKEEAAALIPIQGAFPAAELSGYVSSVGTTRSSRSMQFFLVNGRPVKGKILTAAVDGAFKGRIMPGRHPMCFLNIKVPLSAVDVNVHPAKLEVKFAQEKAVFSAIHNAITVALDGSAAFPEVVLEEKPRKVLPEEERPVPPPVRMPDYGGLQIRVSPEGLMTLPERTSGGEVHALVQAYDVPPKSDQKKLLTHAPESEPFEFDEGMFTIDTKELMPPKKSGSAFGGSSARPAPSIRSDSREVIAAHVEMMLGLAEIDPVALGMREEEEKKWAYKPTEPVTEPAAEVNNVLPEVENIALPEPQASGLCVVGMVFNTYIIAEENSVMWLIDKHAAHEKLIYNELVRNTGAQDIQTLLTPVSVHLTAAEKQACLDNRDILEKCGFEVDDFGLSGLAVRGVPTYLKEEDIPFVLSEMAEKLAGGFETENSILSDLLASISCKAAIKGGSYSDLRELQHLAEQVLSLPDVRNCPHGRPVAVSMSKYQLEKQFKRVL